MTNDLVLSKGIASPVTVDEAKAAILKSASRLGKAHFNKKGEVVVRPKSAINRLKIKTEIDQNRSGSHVVTYSGRLGMSGFMGFVWIVFCILMLMTFVGILLVIFTAKSSRKITAAAFRDATTNAMEALS